MSRLLDRFSKYFQVLNSTEYAGPARSGSPVSRISGLILHLIPTLILITILLGSTALVAGCGRDYKHPQSIDTQRADDMDACWNEAHEYAQKFSPDRRDDEHEAFFNDCMRLRGYKK